MATELKLRKGTTSEHDSFTGAEAEATVDTDKNTIVVHDGETQGGFPLAQETDTAPSVDSVSTLRASSFPANIERLWLSGYYGEGTPGGGFLYRDSDDTDTDDNGGTVFVDDDGVRWKRFQKNYDHVHDFGAKGDGVTDDSDAFQRAMDARVPSRVFVDNGSFLITSPLTMNTGGGGTTLGGILEGMSPRSISDSDTDETSTILLDTPADTWALSFNESSHVKISNVFFNGENSDVYGLDFTRVRYSYIENLMINNCKIAHKLEDSWGTRFYKCSFWQNTETSADIVNEANGVLYSGCHFYFSNYGVKITKGRALTFDSCIFENNQTAILLQNLVGPVYFNNTYIEGPSVSCIEIDGDTPNGSTSVFQNLFVRNTDAESLIKVSSNLNSSGYTLINNLDLRGQPFSKAVIDTDSISIERWLLTVTNINPTDADFSLPSDFYSFFSGTRPKVSEIVTDYPLLDLSNYINSNRASVSSDFVGLVQSSSVRQGRTLRATTLQGVGTITIEGGSKTVPVFDNIPNDFNAEANKAFLTSPSGSTSPSEGDYQQWVVRTDKQIRLIPSFSSGSEASSGASYSLDEIVYSKIR